MKSSTPLWIANKYRKLLLARIVPLKKSKLGDLQVYSLRTGSPLQDPEDMINSGVEFHDKTRTISGDTAIDVGANIGSYTLRLARRFRHVVAFEPNPQMSRILALNARVNKLDNIKVEQAALSDVAGTLPIHIDSRHEGHSSLDARHYGIKYDKSILVRVLRLDDYPLAGPLIDFIKVDAEGHELKVLVGAKRTLIKFKPTIAVEVHSPRISSSKNGCTCETCSYLASNMYDVQVTHESSVGWPVHWAWATPRMRNAASQTTDALS